MLTKLLKINKADSDAARIAGSIIASGGLVAIPTETVYGLGANALDTKAVDKIFIAKGRPQDNPLIVHIADPGQLSLLCARVPQDALALASRFWPGPLTIILEKSALIPENVCAGLETVAVRVPAHFAAREIIEAAGCPVAAPSANLSGRPSPTTAAHVLDDLDGRIDAVVDGGPCEVGLESTVITLALGERRILRPGGVTSEQIESVIGKVTMDASVFSPHEGVAASPGMKYRHYAPGCRLVLVDGQHAAGYILSRIKDFSSPGVLCFDEDLPLFEGVRAVSIGRRLDLASQATGLFSALRRLDAEGHDIIFACCPPSGGLGDALKNRLLRAAAFETVFLND